MNDQGKTHNGVGEEQPSTKVVKFYKLLEDMNEKFYDGSRHSRLHFCIRLFHLKCMCGMSGKKFNYLIEFPKEIFPSTIIPARSCESKKVIIDLDLRYEKIHACPNHCMLYKGDKENQQACLVCGSYSWLPTESSQPFNDDDEVVHKRAAKVLRYFPLFLKL